MFEQILTAEKAAASSISGAEWRWAIFSLATCAIVLAIGLAALGIFLFRKKTRDRTLLYFGVFVLLYAVRMFAVELISLIVSSSWVPGFF
jgi:hypothetical protein